MSRYAVALLLSVALVACSEGSPSGTPTPTGTGSPPSSAAPSTSAGPTAGTSSPPAPPRLALQRIGTFDKPLHAVVLPGTDVLLVVEKSGRVRVATSRDVFLDLSRQVSSGGEQGLLGLAFLPGSPGKVFVDYTDRAGDTVVAEYRYRGTRADPASARVLLRVDQPFANHNGGQLLADPSGHLLVALGDGGSGGDPGNRAQDLGDLLGKYLRIDPEGGKPYGVPADNPFRTTRGARPEIWAYGLRNPWRASFDPETGDFWVGDVGQNELEELDVVPRARQRGANYGWSVFEGNRRFSDRQLRGPGRLVEPALVYGRDDGCSITGGHVYRGRAIPSLVGTYVFGDFCDERLMGVRRTSTGVTEPVPLGPRLESVASFGIDAEGELLVLSLSGGVHRLVAR